jgi:hypothetical protein
VLVDVLADDDLASGTPTLSIVRAPQHGTAVVEGGQVRYPAPATDQHALPLGGP